MGYRIVDATSVEPESGRPCECRKLGVAADCSAMAINRFRAAPGEQLPLAYHSHETQEEAFYVLSGTLHVETPAETHEVASEELFVVDPGQPQRAHNPSTATDDVVVLAIGAPPADSDAVVYETDSSAAASNDSSTAGSDESC